MKFIFLRVNDNEPNANDGNFAKAVIAKAAVGAVVAANEVAAAVGTAAELCCLRCHICLFCTFFASRSKLHAGRVAAPRHRVRLTPVRLPIQSHRVQLTPFYTIVDVLET